MNTLLGRKLGLRAQRVLWVGFNALLWLIWAVQYALTGYWFPWPLFYTVGSAIVISWITWRRSRGGLSATTR